MHKRNLDLDPLIREDYNEVEEIINSMRFNLFQSEAAEKDYGRIDPDSEQRRGGGIPFT
ncbi:hypothetical protein ACFL24_00520 [Patescibacteria group bacterium]